MRERRLRLMLVDEDPVFRLGLRVWLEQFPDIEVVAETDNGTDALRLLETQTAAASATSSGEGAIASDESAPLTLVVLDVSLGRSDPNQVQGLNLCRQLKLQYPWVRVLLLSSLSEPVILAAARRSGADGYCPKQLDPADLEAIIRQVAAGQPHWMQPSQPPTSPDQSEASISRRSPTDRRTVPSPPAAFTVFRRNLRQAGLQRIDTTLDIVEAQLQNLDLSLLDRAVLAGRQRELRAARWVVRQLLATPNLRTEASGPPDTSSPTSPPPPRSNRPLPPEPTASELAPIRQVEGGLANTRNLQALVFDAVSAKLQGSLQNQTGQPLEIDILREDKKRELLYLSLRKLEDILDELRFSQVQLDQIVDKRSLLLLDLWQAVITEYFGKYYTITIGDSPIGGTALHRDIEVVSVLLQDENLVLAAILNKIPFVTDLLAHFLYQTPLVVEGIPYVPGSPEALRRAEAILENFIIQLASAVLQPLLNHFANVEVIKQAFYDYRLMSVREVERFRNNLSWKYRLEQYINEPRAIFESQYPLFILYGRGIQRTSVYAPRTEELERLTGVQYTVTLALETRDAIAPRLRSAISFVGSGLIYLLTEVIGRGIGLIGRGILKGIGTAWQDTRYNRGSDRQKER